MQCGHNVGTPNAIEGNFGSNFRNRDTKLKREPTKKLKTENIDKVAQNIIMPRRKYVIGLRASSGCAYLLGYLLATSCQKSELLQFGDEPLLESLREYQREDILIAISFPRYTKTIVDVLLFAKARKAMTVVITDSILSPPAQVAQFTIDIPSNSLTFANSYTACLAL